MLRAFVVGPAAGLPVLEQLYGVADLRPRVMGTVGRSFALAELGRTDEAVNVVRKARVDLEGLRDPLALMHPSTQVQAAAFARWTRAGTSGAPVSSPCRRTPAPWPTARPCRSCG